jgi:hypothetical protein
MVRKKKINFARLLFFTMIASKWSTIYLVTVEQKNSYFSSNIYPMDIYKYMQGKW